MDRVKLPNPLDPNEWDAKLAELENLQRPLKFSELVDMAHTSFELRVAFDTDYQMGMNRTAKVGYYSQETFKLHGIHPHFLLDTGIGVSELTLQEICEESLYDVDIWDGLAFAVQEILRDSYPLMPASREWASSVIGGVFVKPKEKPGPHPLKYSARDMMIISFLDRLKRINVPITENEATSSGVSACHAISSALGRHFTVPSPKSLMNIWSGRSQSWKDISRNDED